jgi:voltage-gated potassium channel
MDKIKKILLVWLSTITIIVIIGSLGYYIIFEGKSSVIDCVYMTIISLTSVGYGEVLDISSSNIAKLFTMVLITFGMGVILYGISSLTALLVEGELSGILRKNKMDKKVTKLKDHYIICGGGEATKHLIDEMITNHEPLVLIEENQDKIDKCLISHPELLYIKGDCTEDSNLIDAGIKKAKGILITLSSDKDNIYLCMTARMLNEGIRIISRISNVSLEPKLKNAGADSVVSPHFIGSLRMASEMIRPTAVDFLDKMLRSSKGTLRIHEITIPKASGLVGKKIYESNFKDKYGLLILGSKQGDGDIEFNPPHDKLIQEEMILVVMGEVGRINQVRKDL